MALHRITYDGREDSLPCHCEVCGKFAGHMASESWASNPILNEECPGSSSPRLLPQRLGGWPYSAKICLSIATAAIVLLAAARALLLAK